MKTNDWKTRFNEAKDAYVAFYIKGGIRRVPKGQHSKDCRELEQLIRFYLIYNGMASDILYEDDDSFTIRCFVKGKKVVIHRQKDTLPSTGSYIDNGGVIHIAINTPDEFFKFYDQF